MNYPTDINKSNKNNNKRQFELFCDDSYYGMFCVREIHDERFDSITSFHFMDYRDAKECLRLLNKAF